MVKDNETSGKEVPLVLITYHDIFQQVAKQRWWLGEEYQQQSAAVQLSPSDLKLVGVEEGGSIELRSDVGSIVVQAKSAPNLKKEICYMPFSLYSARLAGYDPQKAKLPNLKRIEVIASPTDKNITSISDLQGGEIA